MAKKLEEDKIRFKKVWVRRSLGRIIGEAKITGEYSTMEQAEASPELGTIMTPLQAHNFLKKINGK